MTVDANFGKLTARVAFEHELEQARGEAARWVGRASVLVALRDLVCSVEERVGRDGLVLDDLLDLFDERELAEWTALRRQLVG